MNASYHIGQGAGYGVACGAFAAYHHQFFVVLRGEKRDVNRVLGAWGAPVLLGIETELGRVKLADSTT